MLTLLAALLLIGIIISSIVAWHACEYGDNEETAYGILAMLIVLFIAILIPLFVGIVQINSAKKINAQIAMYAEENAKIESQVTTAVEKYLEHEFNVYESLQGESLETLVIAYPELNSNELVKKQVEIFVENNKQIKKLKNKKLNINTWRFIVYFGG